MTCYRRHMSLPEAAEQLGLVRPKNDTPERAGRRLLRAILAAEARDGQAYLAWRGNAGKVARTPGERGAKGVRLTTTEVMLRTALPECFFARDREAELLTERFEQTDEQRARHEMRIAHLETAVLKMGEMIANMWGHLMRRKKVIGR